MPFRATAAVFFTIIGLVLLFNFKTPDITARPNLVPASISRPSSSPTASASASGSGSPSPGDTPSPSAASGWRNGTYTGQDYPNQFGDVQVAVVISGGKVTDAKPIQMPFDRQRSADISQQAGPLLHDQVLQAQSAQIDGVSGATYTSYSYAESVQSALDQAHS